MTPVDTNGLLDLVTDDPDWAEWSIVKLEEAVLKGALAINDVVCAELSIRYGLIKDLEAMLDDAAIAVARTLRDALFLAGKVLVQYRKSGGARTGVLPDFFIRAHAAVSGADARRRTLSHLFPGHGVDRPGKSALAILVP